jgi:hypothetical protein
MGSMAHCSRTGSTAADSTTRMSYSWPMNRLASVERSATASGASRGHVTVCVATSWPPCSTSSCCGGSGSRAAQCSVPRRAGKRRTESSPSARPSSSTTSAPLPAPAPLSAAATAAPTRKVCSAAAMPRCFASTCTSYSSPTKKASGILSVQRTSRSDTSVVASATSAPRPRCTARRRMPAGSAMPLTVVSSTTTAGLHARGTRSSTAADCALGPPPASTSSAAAASTSSDGCSAST